MLFSFSFSTYRRSLLLAFLKRVDKSLSASRSAGQGSQGKLLRVVEAIGKAAEKHQGAPWDTEKVREQGQKMTHEKINVVCFTRGWDEIIFAHM